MTGDVSEMRKNEEGGDHQGRRGGKGGGGRESVCVQGSPVPLGTLLHSGPRVL